MKQRVENDLFLERETSSGAILNNDEFGYKAILANKKRKKDSESSMRDEIETLKALVASLLKER